MALLLRSARLFNRDFKEQTERLDALHEQATALGVNLLGAFRLPLPFGSTDGYEPGRTLFFHSSVPASFWGDWLQMVDQFGPSACSRRAFREGRPFTFVECKRWDQPTGTDRWIFDLCERYRIKDGYFCPVGYWRVVYYSSRVLRLEATARRALFMMASDVAFRLADMARERTPIRSRGPKLSRRQRQVLEHLCQGADDHQIAERLGIAEGTVRSLVSQAMRKLDAKTREQAIYRAAQLGLIP